MVAEGEGQGMEIFGHGCLIDGYNNAARFAYIHALQHASQPGIAIPNGPATFAGCRNQNTVNLQSGPWNTLGFQHLGHHTAHTAIAG